MCTVQNIKMEQSELAVQPIQGILLRESSVLSSIGLKTFILEMDKQSGILLYYICEYKVNVLIFGLWIMKTQENMFNG